MVTMGPSVAFPAVRAGKIKMLGFGSPKRVPQFPDVPTIAEDRSGLRGERVVRPVRAVETPRDLLVKINADVSRSSTSRSSTSATSSRWWCSRFRDRWKRSRRICKKDSAKWAKVIREANLKID